MLYNVRYNIAEYDDFGGVADKDFDHVVAASP